MNVVVDASAAIKRFFFRGREAESDVDASLALLRGALTDLLAIEMRLVGNEAVYTTAANLAVRLRHHLFDTLYHAVALESVDAVLVRTLTAESAATPALAWVWCSSSSIFVAM